MLAVIAGLFIFKRRKRYQVAPTELNVQAELGYNNSYKSEQVVGQHKPVAHELYSEFRMMGQGVNGTIEPGRH
jgi:hypothetical protein